jgi:hypothetical protein
MATTASGTGKRIYPSRGDAIRVVPLHVPDAATTPTAEAAEVPAAPPQLSYRNGPLIAPVEVLTLLWGSAWQSAQAALAAEVNQCFDLILTSPSSIGSPSTASARTHSVMDGGRGRQRRWRRGLGNRCRTRRFSTCFSKKPQPTPACGRHRRTRFASSTRPPRIKVIPGGSASSTSSCGYHNDMSGQIFYAVMPHPGCGGCTDGQPVFDALPSTTTHERCEAITHPMPSHGWYDDANGEFGDICAWQTETVGTCTVQLEWFDTLNRCASRHSVHWDRLWLNRFPSLSRDGRRRVPSLARASTRFLTRTSSA